VNGGVLWSPFPVVHNQLLCLADVKGEDVVLASNCQVSNLLPVGCLLAIGDQSYHHRVIIMLIMLLKSCAVTQLWVNREYRRGLSTHPWGSPVLRISVADVLLHTLPTWGRPVRKSRIQLQREVLSCRVLRLVMALEGTMVLNAER
jgi:hypothetical protein